MSVVVRALGLIMFAAVFLLLPLGFPVGFTLMGAAMLFALIGYFAGAFDLMLLTALPQRLIGLMENDLLQAIPLFVYLGVIMQRTTLAAELPEAMSGLFGKRAATKRALPAASFAARARWARCCRHRSSLSSSPI
jgi:TRAP-type mannitol/chloroaromatic compound transport system permease large subunit